MAIVFRSHGSDRTSVDVILRLSCSRFVGMYPQSPSGRFTNRPKTIAPHRPRGYRRCNITVVGEDIILPQTNTSNHPHGYRVSANTPLYPSSTIPLFREKDGTKKCLHCIPLRGNRRVLRTPVAQTPPLLPPCGSSWNITRLPMSNHPRGSLRLFAASSM